MNTSTNEQSADPRWCDCATSLVGAERDLPCAFDRGWSVVYQSDVCATSRCLEEFFTYLELHLRHRIAAKMGRSRTLEAVSEDF